MHVARKKNYVQLRVAQSETAWESLIYLNALSSSACKYLRMEMENVTLRRND
jgi:hypothetical protein